MYMYALHVPLWRAGRWTCARSAARARSGRTSNNGGGSSLLRCAVSSNK